MFGCWILRDLVIVPAVGVLLGHLGSLPVKIDLLTGDMLRFVLCLVWCFLLSIPPFLHFPKGPKTQIEGFRAQIPFIV